MIENEELLAQLARSEALRKQAESSVLKLADNEAKLKENQHALREQLSKTRAMLNVIRSINKLLKNKSESLEKKAATDHLTGLLNRRAFTEEFLKRQTQPKKGVIVFLDIDHFKQINDQYTEKGGDAALVAIAKKLEKQMRHGDIYREGNILGRWGGEEFAVYLEDTTAEQALKRFSHLSVHFETNWSSGNGKEVHLAGDCTFSGGASDFVPPENPKDIAERFTLTLNKAQAAKKWAKAHGRNKIVQFNEAEMGIEG